MRKRNKAKLEAGVRPDIPMYGESPLSGNNTVKISSSSKKLTKRIRNIEDDVEQVSVDGFVIFCIAVMRNVFSFLYCPGCKQIGVELEEICERKQGVAVAFRLKCSTCLWEHQFSSSRYTNVPGKKAKNKKVNVRLIIALRNLGIGYDGLQHFCMTLNMNKPMTQNNHNTTVNSLHESYMAEAEQSMKIAAEEVKAKEQSVTTAISVTTGKVKSKRCKDCETHENMDKSSEQYLNWKLEHSLECGTNHVGSSGSM